MYHQMNSHFVHMFGDHQAHAQQKLIINIKHTLFVNTSYTYIK